MSVFLVGVLVVGILVVGVGVAAAVGSSKRRVPGRPRRRSSWSLESGDGGFFDFGSGSDSGSSGCGGGGGD